MMMTSVSLLIFLYCLQKLDTRHSRHPYVGNDKGETRSTKNAQRASSPDDAVVI